MIFNDHVLLICDFDVLFTHVRVGMAIDQEGEYHADIKCKISTNTQLTHYLLLRKPRKLADQI